MASKSNIARLPNGNYSLKLEGRFSHPLWVKFLFSGLSDLKVSVISGRAVQQLTDGWNASFVLDFATCTVPPDAIDYLGLITQEQAPAWTPSPRLHDFKVTRLPDQGLEVRVRGPDQIGFLGRFLVKMSLLSLFPTEMSIDTVGGEIEDTFDFHGICGAAPSEAVRQSLESLLGDMVNAD